MHFPLRSVLFYGLAVVGGVELAALVGSKSRAFPLADTFGWLQRADLRTSVLQKMKYVLGDQIISTEQLEFLWRAHLRHIGQMILETRRYIRMSGNELEQFVSMEGEEHLRAALSGRRGALLLLNHMGNFSMAPILLGRMGCDFTVVRNPVSLLTGRLIREYARAGVKTAIVGAHSTALFAEILRRNGLLGTFFDHARVDRHSAWFDFGGAEVRLHLGPAILALRHKVPALYVSNLRVDATHHRIRIRPPLSFESSGPLQERAVAFTRQIAATLYEDLRQCPEQWWMWDWAPIRPLEQGQAKRCASNLATTK